MIGGLISGLILLVIMLIIYSIPLMLCLAIIKVITTKSICVELKVPIIIIILLILFIIYLNSIYHETPNDLYIKMNEINDNQSLIGLSKEQVVELLGEPESEDISMENKTVCSFLAGKIGKKYLFDDNYYSPKYYRLIVLFDENDKVEHTNIQRTS